MKSHKAQTHSANSTRIFLLWVPWKSRSENKVRSQHWSATHRQNKSAKAAFKFALQSSGIGTGFLTMIISARAETKRCKTPFPKKSESTTAIQESNLSMDK